MYDNFKKYNVKRVVRSFTDLEIYQKTLEASVIIIKNVRPCLAKVRYLFVENVVNDATRIPVIIAEAHSIRFGDHAAALNLLEKAMAGCNKMVVYLEQTKGIYGSKLDQDLIGDLVKRYQDVRTKIFRLEKSWQRWYEPKNN